MTGKDLYLPLTIVCREILEEFLGIQNDEMLIVMCTMGGIKYGFNKARDKSH